MDLKILFIRTLLYLFFALPSSFFDVRKLRIPLLYVSVGIFVYTLFNIFEFYYFYGFGSFFKAQILNMLIAVASSTLLYFLVRLFTANGLGLGDIIFGIYTALYCGFYRNLFATSFAAFSGILFYLAISIIQKFNKKRLEKNGKIQLIHHAIFVIPFVPFITFGAILSVFII